MHVAEDNNSDNVDLESIHQFERILEPYFSKHYRDRCYPGLLFQQGKRKMVQINVPASEFSGLLQAKPSSGNDPDSGKNRPEVKGHAEEIKDYIKERSQKNQPWILGTLTANVPLESVNIIEIGRGICLVVIPRGVKLDITDGQHRKRAIHELIECADSELVSQDDFPITLVLESNFRQCQIDFRDMAQTRALDKSLLLSFGEFSGKVGITKNLINEVPIFHGKTEKIKASPSIKHKLIYTTNYLARFVCCVFANDPNANLQELEVDLVSAPLIESLKLFFAECPNTQYISQLTVEQLTVEEIGKFREDCLLGVSIGIEILGRLLNQIYVKEGNYFNEIQVLRLAREIDWSRENSLWRDSVVRIDPNPKNPAQPYRLSTTTNAVTDAVKVVKILLGWS
jgi:DNA sulfur modification protein DndB